MIIRERQHWYRMLFVWRGSVLRKIYFQLVLIFAYSWLIFYLKPSLLQFKLALNPFVFTLIGLALAIFLGFCNNASYDRFWEGRKLWGALVIDTRNIIRQINNYFPNVDQSEKIKFVKYTQAFCWALNYQLRGKDVSLQLQRILGEDYAMKMKPIHFKPVLILEDMAAWLQEKVKTGNADTIILKTVDEQLTNLSGIVGGCERIFNTPIPFAYHVQLNRTIYIYCFLLPFGLIDSMGWLMPFTVLFISYTFISLDAIVMEISEPFGEEENDLALNSLCENIEFSLNEIVGVPQEIMQKKKDIFID